MKKPRIIRDYLQMGDTRLETFGGYVLSCMNSNPYFTTPLPSLGEVNTAHQQYIAALSAAQGRGTAAVEQKKAMRTALENVLNQLADYVTMIAAGRKPVLVSSGFTVSSDTKKAIKALGKTENFSVALGKNSGEVNISIDPVPGAKYYIFYCAQVAEPLVWIHESDTVPSFTFTGLEPMKPYSFRIVAKGVKGQTAETVAITQAVV
jgi:hypothetical protein